MPRRSPQGKPYFASDCRDRGFFIIFEIPYDRQPAPVRQRLKNFFELVHKFEKNDYFDLLALFARIRPETSYNTDIKSMLKNEVAKRPYFRYNAIHNLRSEAGGARSKGFFNPYSFFLPP
jgi:hypothetical protein